MSLICKAAIALLLGLLPTLVSSGQVTGSKTSGDEKSPRETLPPLASSGAPKNYEAMWRGFDPRAERLETESLHSWEAEGVVYRIVRFRIGVFKGRKAKLAAVYGYPKSAVSAGKRLPALLQIHGGGQYADYQACKMNAKRGYATLSIAWAGRISAPDYRVSPSEVQLFWDQKVDDPAYRVTTDWGAVDGYHAPGRNRGNVFPSAAAKDWTLDRVESPRNSGWFLNALAARRALTFLERQPEVDSERIGVYGHSMGGKLTVMTAPDPRVKAAAPSCGGISDRYNRSSLFNDTLGDHVSLKQIDCPIIFLSPANDFHGRLSDLPAAVGEIKSKQWRVTCSPHHNHQDTPPYEAATLLWFDQHLKRSFTFPDTPSVDLQLRQANGVPRLVVRPDSAMKIVAVDVFFTQQGKAVERPEDMQNTKHRFWRHAATQPDAGAWTARLPIADADRPLWAYANVIYALDKPTAGAGYYYGAFESSTLNVSSVLQIAPPAELKAAKVTPQTKTSLVIESFGADWEKEWFTYRPDQWARKTNKLYDPEWAAPPNAKLVIEVRSEEANKLVVRIDDYAAEVAIEGGRAWRTIELTPADFRDYSGNEMANWRDIKQLTLSPSERFRPPRGVGGKSLVIGAIWKGPNPQFRQLRWTTSDSSPQR